jgi:glutamine amidotransferase
MTRAAVVDYNLGNIPSVMKALERIGVEPILIDGPGGFDDSLEAVVFPGVGHFGAGARNLRDRKLDGPLKEWAAAGQPLLGICVGLQLLFEHSEEDPDARGLGIVDGEVRLLKGPKVPHMGWNTVEVAAGARVLDAIESGEMAYFVHSYYVDPDPSVVVGTTTYDHDFCSAIERDNIVGVQFHPEKSAEVGRKVLTRFFERVVRP